MSSDAVARPVDSAARSADTETLLNAELAESFAMRSIRALVMSWVVQSGGGGKNGGDRSLQNDDAALAADRGVLRAVCGQRGRDER